MCLNSISIKDIHMSNKIPFESEFALHTLTQKHLKELFDLELVASEKQLNKLRVDNLALNKTNCSLVIIEYKNKFDSNVLNQVQEYHDLILENKDEYLKLVNECVDFNNIQIMIISPQFSDEQIKNASDNVNLWQVNLFDDGKVEYLNLKNSEIVTLKIDLDELKITEEKLLEDKSEEMKDLYFNLKNNILKEFKDLKIRYMVDQFSFRANDKLICVVVFLKSSFNIYFYSDNLNNAENTVDISSKSTGGNAKYNFKYKSNEDYDCFLDLFKQTYEQKVKK